MPLRILFTIGSGSRARGLVSTLFLGSLVSACSGRGELREWQPSDHQPPPEVAPEGQGEGQQTQDPAQNAARAAQALWSMRCATCHGPGGRGDGTGKPPGANIPDFSTAAFQEARTDDALREVITKGRGLMPAFGDQLTDRGVDALIQHVRGLKQ